MVEFEIDSHVADLALKMSRELNRQADQQSAPAPAPGAFGIVLADAQMLATEFGRSGTKGEDLLGAAPAKWNGLDSMPDDPQQPTDFPRYENLHPAEARGYYIPSDPLPGYPVCATNSFDPYPDNAEGSKLAECQYCGDEVGLKWRWRFHNWLERVFEALP